METFATAPAEVTVGEPNTDPGEDHDDESFTL